MNRKPPGSTNLERAAPLLDRERLSQIRMKDDAWDRVFAEGRAASTKALSTTSIEYVVAPRCSDGNVCGTAANLDESLSRQTEVAFAERKEAVRVTQLGV